MIKKWSLIFGVLLGFFAISTIAPNLSGSEREHSINFFKPRNSSHFLFENGENTENEIAPEILLMNSEQRKDEKEHKELFPPTALEICGFIVLIIAVAAAQSGGVGGGAIFVPLLQVFMEFPVIQASAVSTSLIFVVSLFRFAVVSFRQKHPYKDKIAIDFDVLMLGVPTLMMGSKIGIIIQSACPDIILLPAISKAQITFILPRLTFNPNSSPHIFKRAQTFQKRIHSSCGSKTNIPRRRRIRGKAFNQPRSRRRRIPLKRLSKHIPRTAKNPPLRKIKIPIKEIHLHRDRDSFPCTVSNIPGEQTHVLSNRAGPLQCGVLHNLPLVLRSLHCLHSSLNRSVKA
jgi:uncharacterized membrane protein YfcA